MDHPPSDADGLLQPAVSPDAAWDAASGLTATARITQAALDVLDATPATALCWTGNAADRYRTVRDRLATRSLQAAELASAGAGVILDWLRDAAPALTAMRTTAAGIEDLQAHVTAAAARPYDPILDHHLQANLDAAYRRWHTAQDTYWSAVHTAATRLTTLRDLVQDRPQDLDDHLDGAFRAAWDGAVTGPATTVWGLTGLALTDRDRWWANVSGLPGEAVATLTVVVTDPLTSAQTVVDWDDWSTGRYGAAGATLATVFLPGPKWLHLGEDLARTRFAKSLADPNAPRPKLQSVDEMVTDGVDLSRHEHYDYGHALRRHVEVDQDYLMDRITHGTLEDVGDRGRQPLEASRFNDRPTAEAAITEAIKQNELEVRGLAHLPVGSEVWIHFIAHQDIGEVMRAAPGGFEVRPGRSLRLAIARGPDGIYIRTAFVD